MGFFTVTGAGSEGFYPEKKIRVNVKSVKFYYPHSDVSDPNVQSRLVLSGGNLSVKESPERVDQLISIVLASMNT